MTTEVRLTDETPLHPVVAPATKAKKRKKPAARPAPDVSVLMRIRDGIDGYPLGSLFRALDSVLGDQPSLNVEVIAVDNGSTDSTGKELAAIAKDDPRLTVVTLKENVGEAGALNIGCEKATGRYCIQLTCRSWFEPDCLKYLVEALDHPQPENDPRVGFAFGQMQVHGLHKRVHTPPPWNLHMYTQTFLANFFMFRRDFYTECGCQFVDYLTLDNGALVGICDRDFMMQMVYNCGADGKALPDVKVINYHFTGDNQMSSVVAANRTVIDGEWRKRWGDYL